jgi:uncharacterized protein (TIGR00369 family)
MGQVLALLKGLVSGATPLPPVARTVGFTVRELDVGRAIVELEVDLQRHGNPLGHVHGGILCDVADAAMGLACASTLADGQSFVTLELKINFVTVVRAGRLQAHGRVVRAGHTVTLTECDIVDAEGALVARASSTCLVRGGAS